MNYSGDWCILCCENLQNIHNTAVVVLEKNENHYVVLVMFFSLAISLLVYLLKVTRFESNIYQLQIKLIFYGQESLVHRYHDQFRANVARNRASRFVSSVAIDCFAILCQLASFTSNRRLLAANHKLSKGYIDCYIWTQLGAIRSKRIKGNISWNSICARLSIHQCEHSVVLDFRFPTLDQTTDIKVPSGLDIYR